MAHEPSIAAIERMEQHFQRLMDLLNEADQALQSAQLSNQEFEKAHHLNGEKSTAFEDAIGTIESLLSQATHIHNETIAHLRDAKEEAAQREADEAE